MAAEQPPAASWGADTDGRLNQPSEHLTHYAMWATDASGNVTGLVGPDGRLYRERSNSQRGSPNYAWGGTNIIAGDYSAQSGSPTMSVVERYGKPALKVVTGAGTTTVINLLIGDTLWYGRYAYEVEAMKSEVISMSLSVSPDGFTNSAQRTNPILTNPVNNPREQQPAPATFWYGNQVPTGTHSRGDQLVGTGASWGASNPSFPTNVNAMRLTITPQSATVATVYIYGVTFAPKRRRGRIFITADDGYESFIRNGLPMCMTRGIPVTMGVITSRVNDRTGLLYVRESDLHTILDAGGQVVAHGPHAGLGAGTLFTAFSSTAERIADMQYTREWIMSHGLATPGSDRCYIWPGGEGQSATGDLDLFDAALAAGFTVARGATPDTTEGYDFNSLTRYQRLMLPIIGHTSASNITTITQQIAFAGDHGLDVCLMLHSVVKAGATPGAIEITTTDLATILDACVTEVETNQDMEFATLGDLAIATDWA